MAHGIIITDSTKQGTINKNKGGLGIIYTKQGIAW